MQISIEPCAVPSRAGKGWNVMPWHRDHEVQVICLHDWGVCQRTSCQLLYMVTSLELWDWWTLCGRHILLICTSILPVATLESTETCMKIRRKELSCGHFWEAGTFIIWLFFFCFFSYLVFVYSVEYMLSCNFSPNFSLWQVLAHILKGSSKNWPDRSSSVVHCELHPPIIKTSQQSNPQGMDHLTLDPATSLVQIGKHSRSSWGHLSHRAYWDSRYQCPMGHCVQASLVIPVSLLFSDLALSHWSLQAGLW